MALCLGYNSPLHQCSNPGVYDLHCLNHKDQCRGVDRNGVKCLSSKKEGYDYCHTDHDPKRSHNYVDPAWFLQPNRAWNNIGDIVKFYNYKDPYHGDALPLRPVALDYKIGGQVAAFVVREARIANPETQDIIIAFLRERLNQVENMVVTRATTSQITQKAVANFLDDVRSSHTQGATLKDYLLAETTGDASICLDSNVVEVILKEMEQATDYFLSALDAKSDMPCFQAVIKQMNIFKDFVCDYYPAR